MPHQLLKMGSRITVLPIIHGSGDCALEVRRVMLAGSFECLAVPLPYSFCEAVETAIDLLPRPGVVVQPAGSPLLSCWRPEQDDEDDCSIRDGEVSFVPIDPCQPVIMALRIALGERLARAYIDLETDRFHPDSAVMPDPYVLKRVPIQRFAGAVLPAIPRPSAKKTIDRIRHMAWRLRHLEQRYRSILLVASVLDWPWIREAYAERHPLTAEDEPVGEPLIYQPEPKTLVFLLGELPFITGLYERARGQLEDDSNLSIDGIKELLIAARTTYFQEFRKRARTITPHTLALCLKYIRNLTLLDRRLTPDLYTVVVAAKQTCGDAFALHVAEAARQYPYAWDASYPAVSVGIDRLRLPDGALVDAVSRLPGPPRIWRSCQLARRPDRHDRRRWRMQWDPLGQCSWPPEDERIENFRCHVIDRAKAIIGADLVRTEKFTTSIKDGIDIRDTLRNWYTGDIYVRILPPGRGDLDAVVMLFDSPADPRDYPWRTTWFAEHQNESTLAFFATDYRQELVGPGIGRATYGGALFLYPPVAIADVWRDRRLDFTETLEERLLAAACLHSTCSQIALVSAYPPGPGWRRLARRYRKKWIHLPLAQFSAGTLSQLRIVHVLNGRQVRSYAAHFIRRA